MKYHFFGSLDGNKEAYKAIIGLLDKMGHSSITDHVIKREIEDVEKETPEESELYVKKMLRWITQSDFISAEVTKPSISIGYEIMVSQQKGKPVIVLYEMNKGLAPHTLRGMPMEKIQIYSYSMDNSRENSIKQVLNLAIEEAKEQMDVRFNFFISPGIGAYLDWVVKNRKLPRAVYLRRLIEDDMKKNKKYSSL